MNPKRMFSTQSQMYISLLITATIFFSWPYISDMFERGFKLIYYYYFIIWFLVAAVLYSIALLKDDGGK